MQAYPGGKTDNCFHKKKKKVWVIHPSILHRLWVGSSRRVSNPSREAQTYLSPVTLSS